MVNKNKIDNLLLNSLGIIFFKNKVEKLLLLCEKPKNNYKALYPSTLLIDIMLLIINHIISNLVSNIAHFFFAHNNYRGAKYMRW